MIEKITSRQNPLIIRLSKLSDKKARDAEGLFRLDGVKLFVEAKKSSLDFEYIFATADLIGMADSMDAKVFEVTDEVLAKLTDEKAPQGIVAFARKFPTPGLPTLPEKFRALLLSSIRDPGNLGTIVRTAYAFGIDRLIISPDCADIYSPKVIRAAMGTIFRQPITIADEIEALGLLKSSGCTVFAAALRDNAMRLGDFGLPDKVCFAVGNEGHGLSEEFIDACGNTVIIPMVDGCESLNAAGAAGILAWEMRKTR